MNEERRRLAPLGDTTEYRVAAGLPDVRGGMVLGGDGTVIGRVVELLVDRDEGRVRYLECELTDARSGSSRLHVPVGLAEVRGDRDEVQVPSITVETVQQLVVYDERALPDDEALIRRGFADVAGGALPEEDEWYDERRFVARIRDDADAGNDEDFSYLAGVGGAMTDDDEAPEVVGEVDAGQIRIPVMEEETPHRVAPEDQPGGADAAMADEPAMREGLRRPD